jgi:Replication-relaxation
MTVHISGQDPMRAIAPQSWRVPVGVPAGSSDPWASSLVRGRSPEPGGTNTPGSSHPSPAGSCRVGARQLARLRSSLSDRDRLVLGRIGEHRYLTTAHVQEFVFTGHASPESAARVCRRVIARLHTANLIRPLARRIGGVRAGSGATVWQLAPAGFRLLSNNATDVRCHEPSPRFLGHCLAVADAHLTARSLSGRHGIGQVRVQVEPLSWRRYTGMGGESRWLQPDLFLKIAGTDHEGAFEDRWFVEVDLGTESHATLLSKCEQYEAYRRSGTEQAHDRAFPRVLWIMHGDRGSERAERLRHTVLRRSGLIPGMFTVITPDALTAVLSGDDTGGAS